MSGGCEFNYLTEITINGYDQHPNPNDTAANRTLNSKGLRVVHNVGDWGACQNETLALHARCNLERNKLRFVCISEFRTKQLVL